MKNASTPRGFQDMLSFPLMEALLGRRSRRFFMHAEIPDGVFAYKSRHDALPLTDLEKMLVISACGGNTSWHYLIYRAARYSPHLANYAGAAGAGYFHHQPGFTQVRLSLQMTTVCIYWRCATRRLSLTGQRTDH